MEHTSKDTSKGLIFASWYLVNISKIWPQTSLSSHEDVNWGINH